MFNNICGMPGNPSFYGETHQDYSQENLQKLMELNINTIFINLAWSRPWIDVVNLEHVAVSKSYSLLSIMEEVQANRKKLSERVLEVKKLGLKAFGLFGIPRYFDFTRYPEEYGVLKGATVSTIEPSASLMCIQSPQVMSVYKELLKDLLSHIPGLDGIQVYTYDELAEVCDVRSDCPRCSGVPVEDRLPSFLNTLYAYLQELNPGMEMWWEPWELTAAQTYKIMQRLAPEIGMACHTTINEVYFINETDIWFRNIAAIANDQGRKLIAELFMGGSSEELGMVVSYPCPRLVYNQLYALDKTPGVTGIKEYFGFLPEYFSVNESVMKKFASGANSEYDAIIETIVQECSPENTDKLKMFWEFGSRVIEMIPWELSWVMRFGNYPPYDSSYWGKVRFVDLMKTPWNTPSWLSNRRSYYLVVDSECNFTQTMQDDIVKRFEMSLDYLSRALQIGKQIHIGEKYLKEFQRQMEALELMECYIRCRLNHLQLSAASKMIREGKGCEADKDRICCLLDAEAENATNLRNIVENSNIPYIFNTGMLVQTIANIQVSITELNKDIKAWAAMFF